MWFSSNELDKDNGSVELGRGMRTSLGEMGRSYEI